MQYISIFVKNGELNKYDLIKMLESTVNVKIIEDFLPFLMIETSNTTFNILHDLFITYASDNYLDLIVWISNQQWSIDYSRKLLMQTEISEMTVFNNETLFLLLIRKKQSKHLMFIKEIIDNNNLLETTKTYIENSMNIRISSDKLYIHRNTLLQRLQKIENLTGLNIKLFIPAHIVYTIIQ